MSLSENIVIDDENDIATIYGTRVSGELLRVLGEPTPPGRWFRMERSADGVMFIRMKFES
jgi:hypothetical protein